MTAKELLAALALPLGVVERTSTMQVITHVKFAEGKAAAVNFHTAVEVDCPLDLSCCAPAKRLSDALSAIAMFAGDSEVKAKLNGSTLELKAGRMRFTMPTLATADFPATPWPAETEPLADWASLVAAIKYTQPLVAPDTDERRFLIGVALQGKDVVASNGHAAAMAKDEASAESNLIIPAKSIAAVCDLVDVSAIARSESTLTLVFAKGRIGIQLVAGRYPDMRRVMPDKHGTDVATIERDAMKRACQAMRKTREAQWTRMSVGAGRLTLEDETATQESRVEVEVVYGGPEWTVGINLDYLTAVVEGLDGPHIQLSQKETGAPLSPMLFTGGKASRSMVVMPAKI